MQQFEIKRLIPIDLFGLDASFTNASLFMVIAVALIVGFLILAMGRRQLVPGRLQSMAELSYEYIANMVRENPGEEGMKYFLGVHDFMFILTLNLLGMIPHSFTVTSHIIVTLAFAVMVVVPSPSSASVHGAA
jgi:F-type H+-transporting ATPase subunit a